MAVGRQGLRLGFHLEALAVLVLACMSTELRAATGRENVVFDLPEMPSISQRAAVSGDLLELGGSVLDRSIDLLPDGNGGARITVSLPVNSLYSFHSHFRAVTGCTQTVDRVHSRGIGMTTAKTDVALSKTLYYHSKLSDPVLFWRNGAESFRAKIMTPAGDGRETGETRWMAAGIGTAHGSIEFYVEPKEGGGRDPAAGTYRTYLETGFLQDGEIFSYVPAPKVSPGRLEPVATKNSTHLGQDRPYQVFLPRGYDEHTNRRYPVVYLHDGDIYYQFSDPGLSTINGGIGEGRTGEFIIVGVVTLSTRFADLTPFGDTTDAVVGPGRGDKYALFIIEELKPIIDAKYRTLPDAEHTATAGFSLGGLIAAYMGWEFNDHFRRAGCQAGSFWVPNWVGEMLKEPKPPLRAYFDSGDPAVDNYDSTLLVRNDWLLRKENPSIVEDDLRFVYACGQSHTFEEAGTRLDEMLEFLFPANESPSELPAGPKVPLARFLADFDCAKPGTEFCLDGRQSLTPDGTALSRFDWDFGNGVVGEGPRACHTFQEPGETSVTLRVKNDLDLVSEASRPICVTCWESSLPAPWTVEDIGSPVFAGGTRLEDGGAAFTACAGGRILSGAADAIHFAHQEFTGDGVVTLHIVDVKEETPAWQVGIMMREELGPGSRYAAMSVLRLANAAGPRLALGRRTVANISSTLSFAEIINSSDFWIRLERRGKEFRGQGSLDGLTWTAPKLLTLALAPSLRVGVFAAGNEALDSQSARAIFTARIGSFDIQPIADPRPSFSRGDANADGEFDLTDAVFVLGYQFLGGVAPACLDAADIDDSGQIDVTDAVYGLAYQFLGGGAPPVPFPGCGVDPTDEGVPVGCGLFARCGP